MGSILQYSPTEKVETRLKLRRVFYLPSRDRLWVKIQFFDKIFEV